ALPRCRAVWSHCIARARVFVYSISGCFGHPSAARSCESNPCELSETRKSHRRQKRRLKQRAASLLSAQYLSALGRTSVLLEHGVVCSNSFFEATWAWFCMAKVPPIRTHHLRRFG